MTQTSNHGWEIPTVGEDGDAWGEILNNFFDGELDRQVKLEGPLSERPDSTSENVKYFHATDEDVTYYNDDASWGEFSYGKDASPTWTGEHTFANGLSATNLPVLESGQGIEIGHNGTWGRINSIDRDVGDNLPLRLRGNPVYLSGGNNLRLDTGQAIEDGSGNRRVQLGSSNTNLRDGKGDVKFVADNTGVEVRDSNLTLDTGQAIEDGNGVERYRLQSGTTRINDPNGTNAFVAWGGDRRTIHALEGNDFTVVDEHGSFDAYKYIPSASSPGTLELTNAELTLSGNGNAQIRELYRMRFWNRGSGGLDPYITIGSDGALAYRNSNQEECLRLPDNASGNNNGSRMIDDNGDIWELTGSGWNKL